MQRSTQISSIIEKRRPLAQKLESVEANLRSLALALHQLEKYRDQLLSKIDDPSTNGRLREIDCSTIQRSIDAELVTLSNLRSRFSRNTLNIGVVGRARQGKSRLLQSLTGLSAAEIPDGDRQHCTGVRSTIHHNPDIETYAEVCFHSEGSFLDEIIAPYYEQLHLGSRPLSIQEFANSPPAPLPSVLSGQAVPQAKYEHLSRYHKYLHKYRDALLEPSLRHIHQQEIREYVAQDTVDGQRIYFNYMAVREVKIVCSFPNTDIGRIALVDMPGLGDTGIGDAERTIKTLGRDIDMVLFVRMPKAMGDFWGVEDVELYDMASSALMELPIKQWSFMVLNRVSPRSGKDDNLSNCQSLAETIAEKHIDVVNYVIANCADPEEANTKILDRVLEYLTQRIDVLDRQYASACQDRLTQLQKAVKAELEKANSAWRQASQENWFPEFVRLFNKLWTDLTGGLEGLLLSLINARDIDDKNFIAAVESAINDCRSDTGIPTLDEIERMQMRFGAYNTAYDECLHKVRTHLSKRFLSLDIALKESLEETKSKVVEVLVKQGKLGRLADAKGSQFLKMIAERIPENLSKLKLGFQTLATFDLLYRGLIQHRIRKHLDVLTPNRTPYQLTGGFFDMAIDLGKLNPRSIVNGRFIDPGRPNAEKILTNLRKAQAEAVNNCEKELRSLLKDPSQAGFAIVEEFVDRVLRAEGVYDEWQIFLQEIGADVWTEEFDSTMRRTQLRREWLKVVEQAEKASQSAAMNFLK